MVSIIGVESYKFGQIFNFCHDSINKDVKVYNKTPTLIYWIILIMPVGVRVKEVEMLTNYQNWSYKSENGLQVCDPVQQGTSCRPGFFWDNEQNSVQNKRKFTLCINYIFKSIAWIVMNVVPFESLLNLQLDNAKISIISKVDNWCTFCCIGSHMDIF